MKHMISSSARRIRDQLFVRLPTRNGWQPVKLELIKAYGDEVLVQGVGGDLFRDEPAALRKLGAVAKN